MVNVNTSFAGDLWFFTHEHDPKVNEVKDNPQVNVSFVSPDGECYVSVSGRASLVRDQKRRDLLYRYGDSLSRESPCPYKDLLWTDACQKWFPEGEEDAQLALLRIDVEFAEYWDEKTRIMKSISGLMKQAFAGDRDTPTPLEHEKIDWQAAAKNA